MSFLHRSFAISLLAAAVALFSPPAMSKEVDLADDVKLSIRGVMTLGTTVRTEEWDPAVLGAVSSSRVGAPAGYLSGNAGGGNLNFPQGKPVSTVAKGLFSLELKRQGFGVFLSAKGWYDQELEDGRRPYGNAPNRFAQNVPLSDSGFDANARFTNFLVNEANVFGNFALGDSTTLETRVGRQTMQWGAARMTGGGVNTVTPLDLPGMLRPGALPDEIRLPLGMAYARLNLSKETKFEAWIPYEFRSTVLPPCGTFYASNSFAPQGCNFVSVLGAAGVNDPIALSTGRFPKRDADVLARDSGQFGLSVAHHFTSINSHVQAYLVRHHSLLPFARVINANINGGYGDLPSLTRLTDPNGLKYAMTFPEHIHMAGLTAKIGIAPATQVYTEIAYRPDQPLSLNLSDAIAAFLQRTPNSALNLAKGTNAIPPGGIFDAYDRFKVTTLIVGVDKAFPGLAASQQVTLLTELGLSHVSGLPDPGRLRYGRPEEYGTAQVASGAPCVDNTVAKKSCALDGFVTANAWGYRVRAAATYPGAFLGARLTPSIAFAHDVSGYSHDSTYIQGRKMLETALRAEWGQQYFAGVAYNVIHGGKYVNSINRDTVSVFVGTRF